MSSAKSVPFANCQDRSDFEPLIGNHVKMHAVFIVQFKDPNAPEANLPLKNG
jgi:hypothetical protein